MSASSFPERYRKQVLFSGLGEEGQQRLLKARALVVGCGALGSVIVQSLARSGVGLIRIVDRDFVELSNLQRQVLYDEEDVRQRLPKAMAAATKLRQINSEITIEPHVADVTFSNILELARDVDVIVDGTDNFEIRFLINDVSVETGIPWVHAGCVGSAGQMMTIIPGQTPCLRCLMPEIPGPGSGETCETAGVLGAAVQIMASLQVVDALKILSGQLNKISSSLLVVDVWDGSFRRIKTEHLLEENRCPCCQGTERLWLQGKQGAQTAVLCGRNSVQISPSERTHISLDDLSEKLKGLGKIRRNAFLLIFQPEGESLELILFQDGRAIVSGTEDPAVAKTCYARFIGQ